MAASRTGLSPVTLVVGYSTLVLAPLLLTWLTRADGSGFARDLSVGVGIAGYAMLLLQFVSSGRFEWLSGRIGIDQTMRFHQLAARLLLLLIVLHPFLLIAPAMAIDPAAALRRLWQMFTSPGLRTGVVAWLLLIALVAAAIWRDRLPVSYEIWRASHGLAALIVALAGAEHTLGFGERAGSTLVRPVWLVLALFATAALAFVYLVKPMLMYRQPWRISGKRSVGAGLWEVEIEPVRGKGLSFEAGQFVWAGFSRLPLTLLDHPFSIASAPDAGPGIRLLIAEGGDFTNRIGSLPVGNPVWLDGPHGNFTLAGRSESRICLIAGGVGLAPMLGILEDLERRRDRRPVTLIQAARSPRHLAFRSDLSALEGTLDLRRIEVVRDAPAGWQGERGEVDRRLLERVLQGTELTRTIFLICGPPAMTLVVEAELHAAGVPRRQIVRELFTYTARDTLRDRRSAAGLAGGLVLLAAALLAFAAA